GDEYGLSDFLFATNATSAAERPRSAGPEVRGAWSLEYATYPRGLQRIVRPALLPRAENSGVSCVKHLQIPAPPIRDEEVFFDIRPSLACEQAPNTVFGVATDQLQAEQTPQLPLKV